MEWVRLVGWLVGWRECVSVVVVVVSCPVCGCMGVGWGKVDNAMLTLACEQQKGWEGRRKGRLVG